MLTGVALGGRALWQRRAPTAPTAEAGGNTAGSVATADTPGDIAADPASVALDSAAAPAVALTPDSLARIPAASSDTGIQAPGAGDSSVVRWVTATAITWANVRSEPSRQAGIVAVISPDMRVRLGDAREGWHRVKAGGIDGWVDRRLFTIDDGKAAR